MEITITINGKPVQATVDDAVIREAMGDKKEKKTGYEKKLHYYFQRAGGYVTADADMDCQTDKERYAAGNYYSSEKVAQNNARADNLMRNLRRFAAEHGGCGKLSVASAVPSKGFDSTIVYIGDRVTAIGGDHARVGGIYFKDIETARTAIEAFRDELTWYFTEYDPMPEGWWDQ